MAKEYKPGFVYIKSDLLHQEVAISEKTGWLFCEDGVRYSPQELARFEEAGIPIDLCTHIVKRVLGGEVVQVGRPADKGKPVEGGQNPSPPPDTNTGEKIPGIDGACPPNREGELDIF